MMLQYINSLANKDNTFCYLECAGIKNRSFYQKNGYQRVKAIPIISNEKDQKIIPFTDDGGESIMIRYPQPKSTF